MDATTEATLTLGYWVYMNSAWLRSDHPDPARRAELNERLIGLVDDLGQAIAEQAGGSDG